MQRSCGDCKRPIPPQKGPGRPRGFCDQCRPPRGATVTRISSPAPPESLLESTRQRLTFLGRAATPEGMLVLELARQIDAGGHSGASLASLSTAFTKALDKASEGAEQGADVIDGIFGVGS